MCAGHLPELATQRVPFVGASHEVSTSLADVISSSAEILAEVLMRLLLLYVPGGVCACPLSQRHHFEAELTKLSCWGLSRPNCLSSADRRLSELSIRPLWGCSLIDTFRGTFDVPRAALECQCYCDAVKATR